MNKYSGIRKENNKDKTVRIEGYLYTCGGELYLIPNEDLVYNKTLIPNHMYLVLPEGLFEIEKTKESCENTRKIEQLERAIEVLKKCTINNVSELSIAVSYGINALNKELEQLKLDLELKNNKEVKTAKWVDVPDDWFRVIKCSNCDYLALEEEKTGTCSSCGSVME